MIQHMRALSLAFRCFCASAMPTDMPAPCPRGPVVHSTPGVNQTQDDRVCGCAIGGIERVHPWAKTLATSREQAAWIHAQR